MRRSGDEPAMTPASPGSQLCLCCGICCMGVLFDNAEIGRNSGLDGGWYGAVDEDPLLPLACPLYREEQCAVFHHPERPDQCPEYRCGLLEQLDAGEIDVDQGRLIVGTVKTTLAAVLERLPRGGKPRKPFKLVLDDAVAAAQREWDAGNRSNPELLTAMLSLKRMVDQYFLPGEDR